MGAKNIWRALGRRPFAWAFGEPSNFHGPLRLGLVLVPWLLVAAGVGWGLSWLWPHLPTLPGWLAAVFYGAGYLAALAYELRRGR